MGPLGSASSGLVTTQIHLQGPGLRRPQAGSNVASTLPWHGPGSPGLCNTGCVETQLAACCHPTHWPHGIGAAWGLLSAPLDCDTWRGGVPHTL